MSGQISLKLAWADGNAEIACDAEQFQTVVAAAEKLLAAANSQPAVRAGSATPPSASTGEPPSPQVSRTSRAKRASPSAGRGETKTSLGGGQYKDFADFKWNIDDATEVRAHEFYKNKAPKGQQESVAVIISALRDICDRPL